MSTPMVYPLGHGSPLTTTLHIANIHCNTCITLIDTTLSALKPIPTAYTSSTTSNSVIVNHTSFLSPRTIANSLFLAGFEISHCQTVSPNGDTEEIIPLKSKDWLAQIGDSIDKAFATRKRKRHVESCQACQDLRGTKAKKSDDVSSNYSYSSSSGRSRTHSLRTSQHDMHSLDIEAQLDGLADTVTSTTTAPAPGLQSIVIENLDSNGGDLWQVSISIRGMSCSSCVVSIRAGLKNFACIEKAEISALTHGGTVVFHGKENAAAIIEKIDEMGFDADLLELNPFDESAFESKERTMMLQVEGLYCPSCPSRVMEVFKIFPPNQLAVLKALTSEKDPTIRYRYTPQPDITTRKIIEEIEKIDDTFKVTVQNAQTIEERGESVHRAELIRISLRLSLCVIVAIPTFIIGIVFTSLLNKTHYLRKWIEEPIWAGQVSRAEWALFIMATPIYFFAADLFHTRAITELKALWSRKNTRPVWKKFVKFGSMNLLMSLGTTIAYFASIALLAIDARAPKIGVSTSDDTYFDAVVFLTMFLLVGRVLESYSKAKSANAVSLLGKLRPSEAFLVTEYSGEIGSAEFNISSRKPVAVELLEVGDLVQVSHGQSPPSDGKIIQGETKFNESSLTGESRLIPKATGDNVFTGTINHGGVITVQIATVAGKSMLDQIVQVVREGQAQRAPIERIADVVTGYFVPLISYLAVITWVIWLALGYSGSLPQKWLKENHGGWAVWSMSFAIAVFVIACPCGIGLAAPTALFIGTGLAAKYGILAKGGGEAFQEASFLDIIVFDKTGTLTEGGEPKITDFELYLEGGQGDLVYAVAEELENVSSHPLARAIVGHANKHERIEVEASNIEELPGRGIRGTFGVAGAVFEALIGNELFMAESSVDIDVKTLATLDAWKRGAKSVVLLAMTKTSGTNYSTLPLSQPRLVACFAAADPIRAEATSVIESLQSSGIAIYMISGDNVTTAKAVATTLSIPAANVIAGVLPTEKADKIKYLQTSGPKRPRSFISSFFHRSSRPRVAMVGDGINDAPALTMSDVGIAIGSGADIAIGCAGFILLNSDLNQILLLTDLAKMVFRRVKFNFFWAGFYNTIGIPIAAGCLYGYKQTRLDPAWAALAMALSSVSVVGSSLLLKSGLPWVSFKPRKAKLEKEGKI